MSNAKTKKSRQPCSGIVYCKAKQYEEVVLVLQGGGALGSYQAGVYEGLANAGIHPNWVAGISIGAINSALIAGNPPEDRVAAMRGFWDRISGSQNFFGPALNNNMEYLPVEADTLIKRSQGIFSAWQAIAFGQKGFFSPRLPGVFPVTNAMPDEISYYHTDLLQRTLQEFVDFKLINQGGTRVSVGAVNVRTGNFIYFDNAEIELKPEHFIASGALPPGFPAVKIDGEYYWDGGLVSNTPLTEILLKRKGSSLLVFQVDLWSAQGPLPKTFDDVSERIKDIQFSSRTRAATDAYAQHQEYEKNMKELLALIPKDVRIKNPICIAAEKESNLGIVNLIHLIYSDKIHEGSYKDFEFSIQALNDHWQSGLDDIEATFKNHDWLDKPSVETGMVTHDIHRKSKAKK